MDELRADQGTSLHLGTSVLRPAHTWALLGVLLGLPVIAGATLIYLIATDLGRAQICPAIWTALWNALTGNPANRVMLWLLPVLLATWLVVFIIEGRARLRITPAGLEADIPRLLGIGFLRQTAGQWSVRWEDVVRVLLLGAKEAPNALQRLAAYRLVIETKHGQTWLAAIRWFEPGEKDHRLRLGDLRAWRTLDPAARLESAPLVRAIRARGLAIDGNPAAAVPGTRGFDLARHKGMMAQVCVLFVAGLYAVVDTFFIEGYLPLGRLPLWPFVVTGVIAALAASRLGRGAPAVERFSVGALAVAACMAAAYPAVLRFNAATAEAETVAYVSVGAGRFEARDGRLPAIDLSKERVDEYWALYPPGTEHAFTLLRGRAGFFQLDMRPFYEGTRRFYRDRES